MSIIHYSDFNSYYCLLSLLYRFVFTTIVELARNVNAILRYRLHGDYFIYFYSQFLF